MQPSRHQRADTAPNRPHLALWDLAPARLVSNGGPKKLPLGSSERKDSLTAIEPLTGTTHTLVPVFVAVIGGLRYL